MHVRQRRDHPTARTEGLLLIFDGAIVAAYANRGDPPARRRQPRLGWCTEPQAGRRINELLAQRIRAAAPGPRRDSAFLQYGRAVNEKQTA
jgi:hypothetical protein